MGLKQIYTAIMLLACSYVLTACPNHQWSTRILEIKEKNIKHNYIAIRSSDNSQVDVDVSYYVLDSTSKQNKLQTFKCTTPCILGGEDIKVVYELIEESYGNHVTDVSYQLSDNDNNKHASYISINNSNNKNIEYALVEYSPIFFIPAESVHDYHFQNSNIIKDSTKVIDRSPYIGPSPIYKWTPVLYLIKPELAPNALCYVYESTGYGNPTLTEVPLKKPYFGELVVNDPYSPSQIIDIYKEEANSGGVLFLNYDDVFDNRSLKNIKGELEKHLDSYYGVLKPNENLAEGKLSFISVGFKTRYTIEEINLW